MSSVVEMWAWPRMRLTWATSRRRSTIRWLANVWRRSWKRSGGQVPSLMPAASAAWRQSAADDVALGVRGAGVGDEDPVGRVGVPSACVLGCE